ncbi:hypothetical protein ABD87_15080 [Lysinibacillus sphaericus]|uniref:hypothetical protein n=1 Tax=Lysinibacillus sphaericus TaxID=1421 RepID=UPI0018CFB958|nr:hypothetical protein [Lysinibacillus sphaericus]MBG9730812.1 hypothetical protein [Lysinibacillus sphaericus]
MSDFEKIINKLVATMSVESYKETNENQSMLINELKEIKTRLNGDFLSFLDISGHKFGEVIQAVYDIPLCHNDWIVRYIANGSYKEFHAKRIEKMEGSACSVDKASFITGRTIKALKEQQNLSLYDDYQNVEQIKEDKERQAYWSPQSIKDTDEAMKLFWDWLNLDNYITNQDKVLTGVELAELYGAIKNVQNQNKQLMMDKRELQTFKNNAEQLLDESQFDKIETVTKEQMEDKVNVHNA